MVLSTETRRSLRVGTCEEEEDEEEMHFWRCIGAARARVATHYISEEKEEAAQIEDIIN